MYDFCSAYSVLYCLLLSEQQQQNDSNIIVMSKEKQNGLELFQQNYLCVCVCVCVCVGGGGEGEGGGVVFDSKHYVFIGVVGIGCTVDSRYLDLIYLE